MAYEIGMMPIAKRICFSEASCRAYDLPFLIAYHIEKPPTKLLLAEPAPSRANSLRRSGNKFNSKAVAVARDIAANAAAEKPSPFPSRSEF